MTRPMIDPVCLAHGLPKSTHQCIMCCLCYKELTVEECHLLPDGSREDVCNDCAALEEQVMSAQSS